MFTILRARQSVPRMSELARTILARFAVVVLLLLAFHWLTGANDDFVDPSPVDRPPAEGAPATVLAQHESDCWTGDAPDDVDLPGAVIWQHPDGLTVYSKTLVGPALDSFADGDLPGRPIAFCRGGKR